MSPKTKKCSRCGAEKTLDKFNKRASARDGLRTSCQECDASTRGAWKAKQSPPTIAIDTAPAPSKASETPGGGPDKVIGRIGPLSGPSSPPKTVIKEVAVTDDEALEKQLAAEYAQVLNEKLPVRKRAALMVKIAKQIDGFKAGLALKALQDINLATGVTSKSGAKLDVGPLFVLPDGTNMKMTGS